MSYYEKRIADLEARVAEMALQQRMKAIPVEGKLLERYALMQAENARLKAEVESLRKELADAQENYHIVNEMVAKMLKEGKQT